MSAFQVQILESIVHIIEVQAEDSESAVDAAFDIFSDSNYHDDPYDSQSTAELVTNVETGEEVFR